MKTRRLYWDDPLLLDFEAEVVGHAPGGFVLAETAFYPEAGGQLADRGSVEWAAGRAELSDAQVDDQGRVIHIASTLPPVGERVRVRIDESRRRAHMSLHTGQHMLSRALLDVAGAPTISSRLGETLCTIDTPLEKLSDEALADAEELVGKIVLEDRPVRAWIPSPEELARISLRREPKVSDEVRIVDVDGFDVSPCGGTHAVRTGGVGAVRIVGVERYKGGQRITFHTGQRVVRDAAAKDRVLRELTLGLTCGIDELPGVIEKMRTELRDQQKAATAVRERLARYVADELLAKAVAKGGARWVIAALDESVEGLRSIAARITESPDTVALLAAPSPTGLRVLVQRGAEAGVDAGATLKALAAAAGGRGGGRPDRAEGQLPAGVDLAAVLATLP